VLRVHILSLGSDRGSDAPSGVQHEGKPTGVSISFLRITSCSLEIRQDRDVRATQASRERLAEADPSINGVESYVATPSIDYPKDKVVLFLPDIFGHTLVNAQVCALNALCS
jgi:hypothetical protein